MAFCTYCGTKLDDSAKFCTACGAKVEQAAPAAPVVEAAPVTEAPAHGSYTAPVQKSTPVEGSYTAPAAQYTPAAESSGSYTPPQQSYSSDYAPKAKAKAPKQPAQGGKRKLGPIIAIAAVVLLVIILVASCGGKKDKDVTAEDISGADFQIGESGELTALQEKWNGTWYGMMYVYDAEGDFAGIPSDEYDTYMVVDVDAEGKGSLQVYLDNVDEPFAEADCVAYDYGLDVTGGSIAGMADINSSNWIFRAVPDYPDRYTITDTIEDGDSLFDYTLFFKKWGVSWQDEIDGDELLPPSVDWYEEAIANGEQPPVGGAGNAGAVSPALTVENPSVWYGWVSFTEFENIESDDLMYDAWAYVGEDSDGKAYFEVYQDGYPNTALMSMYADISGSRIIPVIGDEDAWFSDTYLAEEDADMYVGVLGEDGVLRFDYFFTHYDGEYGYRVQMYLREDGTAWDEDNDILPPRYDEYKAALAEESVEPAPAQESEAAPAPAETKPAETSSAPSGFGGSHTFTIDEFMTEIEATFTFDLPEAGWCPDAPNRTIYIYNVPTLNDAYSDSPRIQFELKENRDKLDTYKDKFENLKEIDSRTIGGIEMQGRTYKYVGMEWTEYYGELPNGIWVSCKISDVDMSGGSEGDVILNSVSIK